MLSENAFPNFRSLGQNTADSVRAVLKSKKEKTPYLNDIRAMASLPSQITRSLIDPAQLEKLAKDLRLKTYRKPPLAAGNDSFLRMKRNPNVGTYNGAPFSKQQFYKKWDRSELDAANKGLSAMYPSWGQQLKDRMHKAAVREQNNEKIEQELTQPNSIYFNLMQAKGRARWDRDKQMWEGKQAAAIVNRTKDPKGAFAKKLARSNQLINTSLTQDQTNEQVPLLVKSIVDSSAALSTSGFGPLKRGGLALYAGRWIDPVSGRVRLLPPASSDYVNPLSFEQNRQLRQARILNSWNKLVDEMDSYLKIEADGQDKFLQKQFVALKRKTDMSNIQKRKAQRYINSLVAVSSGTMLEGTVRYNVLLQFMNYVAQRPDLLINLNEASSEEIEEVNSKFDELMKKSLEDEAVRITADKSLNGAQRVNQRNAAYKMAHEYIYYDNTAIKNGYKAALKASLFSGPRVQERQKDAVTMKTLVNEIRKGTYDKIANVADMKKELQDFSSTFKIGDLQGLGRYDGYKPATRPRILTYGGIPIQMDGRWISPGTAQQLKYDKNQFRKAINVISKAQGRSYEQKVQQLEDEYARSISKFDDQFDAFVLEQQKMLAVREAAIKAETTRLIQQQPQQREALAIREQNQLQAARRQKDNAISALQAEKKNKQQEFQDMTKAAVDALASAYKRMDRQIEIYQPSLKKMPKLDAGVVREKMAQQRPAARRMDEDLLDIEIVPPALPRVPPVA